MIKREGVKKSTKDVVNGIRKLFGSLPLLNKNIALTNKNANNDIKRIKTVIKRMKIIKKGFIISILVIIPML